jgi:hypothetical protein
MATLIIKRQSAFLSSNYCQPPDHGMTQFVQGGDSLDTVIEWDFFHTPVGDRFATRNLGNGTYESLLLQAGHWKLVRGDTIVAEGTY